MTGEAKNTGAPQAHRGRTADTITGDGTGTALPPLADGAYPPGAQTLDAPQRPLASAELPGFDRRPGVSHAG